MTALTGDGVLTVSGATLSGGGIRHITGTGVLLPSFPVVISDGIVPDSSIWDNNDEEWGQADLVYSEARPIMLVGIEFYRADDGIDFGPVPIDATLTRTGLTIVGQDRFGQFTVDPGVMKQVCGMWPIFQANPGTVVQLWAGGQENPDDPITWEGPYDFRIGIDSFQDFTVSGRYNAVRFTSVAQKPWSLLSYDLDIEPVGER